MDELPEGLFKAVQLTPPLKHFLEKNSRSTTPDHNSNRTTPQSEWSADEGIRSNAGTPTYAVLNRCQHPNSKLPPKFPDIPDLEKGIVSIPLILILPEKSRQILHPIEECTESPVTPVSVKRDILDEEKAEDKKEVPNREPSLSVNFIYYSKSVTSTILSLVASTGLALFAYNLGIQANEVIAYILASDALVSNAILYHKTIMGLIMDDFKLDFSGSLFQNIKTLSFVTLKFSIALISSIPLAFVTYLVNLNKATPLAYTSCASSLVCTIPLFYKAQTALVDYVRHISNLVNEKDEDKKIRGWDYHNAIEELTALDRDEINVLYKEFLKLKAAYPENNVPNDEFESFISLMLPKELNTHNRFWLKEIAGASFGAFSAVFGGMYLFLVSDPIYESFLQESSHANGLEQLSQNYKDVSLAGAGAVSIGQNSLQAKSAYDISKIYATKLIRSYEKRVFKKHILLSVKRNISQCQQFQKYGLDISKAILAAGSATARAAIAFKYINDPALLGCVLTGADISFFTTFYRAMSYIEHSTETEKCRREILDVINTHKKSFT